MIPPLDSARAVVMRYPFIYSMPFIFFAKEYRRLAMKSLSILSIALVALASPALAQSNNPLRTTTPMGQFNASSAPAAAKTTSTQSINQTKQMQETQMSFNLQYLQLQSQMQNENRSYTAVSNIMKSKHDTVKNSIKNVR
jgi:hypothetical protein